MEPFTLIEETQRPGPHHLFDDVVHFTSGKTADHDLQYIAALRAAYPDMIVTGSPQYNVPLRAFAAAGFASCELDTETDSFASWRGFSPPALRQNKGRLAESIFFAKYHYKWNNEDFILYTVSNVQYILKERRGSEPALGPSKATDALIQTAGDWLLSDQQVVWVYDGYWQRSKQLYQQVMKATWEKVILDEKVKKDLTSVTNTFFSSKQTYDDLGVPWKRGLLFHGPPGNGKTISIKALMHTLLDRKDPIPTLYVRSAPQTYDIARVFNQARALTPCMLILEDVETIVTPQTRSYFFNEMDGLENNDGLFVVASTNFLERLDPGLSKRPSRFDRKYLFPLPNEHERTLYCEFWRHKLAKNPNVEFPKQLSPAMARITPGFSFAFLQECFVATLLAIARDNEDEGALDGDDLDDFVLWRAFKEQAEILRKEVEGQKGRSSQLLEWCKGSNGSSDMPSVPTFTDETDHLAGSQPHVDGRYGQQRTVLPDLESLRVKDEVLPALSYYSDKKKYINSAAFMYEL